VKVTSLTPPHDEKHQPNTTDKQTNQPTNQPTNQTNKQTNKRVTVALAHYTNI
jgi:hypothetical protein